MRAERFRATEDVPILPPPEAFPNETVIVGGYTRITMTSRVRYRLDEVLISIDHTKETPSALAKDYLKVIYKKGPVVTSQQGNEIDGRIEAHPLYATPCEFETGSYVDIVSCYWSVMSVVGWDVDYWPGRWISLGRPPFDFPWPTKGPARHCLVSCATSTSMLQWDNARGPHLVKSFNPLLNRSLYLLINDVLNAIAKQAIASGAVYVHTDGFICPDDASTDRVCQVIADWGLTPRIKARGRGFVLDSQSYRVGSMHSKHAGDHPRDEYMVKDVEYWPWLQARLSWAAGLNGLRLFQ